MATRQLDEEAIFNVARKISDADARTQYLAQVCGDDGKLRHRTGQTFHLVAGDLAAEDIQVWMEQICE
jgi:hypothetical protein